MPTSTCSERITIATLGWRARISRAARSPSSVWVGGMRMSTIARSGRCAVDLRAAARRRSPTCAATSTPASRSSAASPSRTMQVVVGDHDAHGSSARDRPSRARRAGRRAARRRAPRRGPRGRGGRSRATRPRRRCRCRRSRPSRRGARAARRARAAVACRRTSRRWRAPRRRRSRPRARSAGAAARATSTDTRRQDRRAAGERLERRGEPVVEHGGMDAAGELAQLLQRVRELVAGRVHEPLAARGSLSSGARIRRSWSAMPTSRCCAPSCRLRSSRRRSVSPAATSRSRDARSSASARARLASAATRSRARSPPPRRPPRPASGSSSSELSYTSTAIRRRRARLGAAVRSGAGGGDRRAVRRRRSPPGTHPASTSAGSPHRARQRGLQGSRRASPAGRGRGSRGRRGRAASATARTGTRAARVTSDSAAIHSSTGDRDPVTRSFTSSAANSSRHAAPATLGSKARRRGAEATRQRRGEHGARPPRHVSAIETPLDRVDDVARCSASAKIEQQVAVLGVDLHEEQLQHGEREREQAPRAGGRHAERSRPLLGNVSSSRTKHHEPDVGEQLRQRQRRRESSWLSSGSTNDSNPVATIRRPLRLSGRRLPRDQAARGERAADEAEHLSAAERPGALEEHRDERSRAERG